MREPRQIDPPSARAHALVGGVLCLAAAVTVVLGPLPFAVFVAVVGIAAYVDLRALLGERGHPSTMVIGAMGTVGFLWSGYRGDVDLVPAVGGALLVALLVTRIALNEAGSSSTGVAGNVTADLSATLGATGLVGLLGAHVLLIREVPRFGYRGIVAFGVMALADELVSFAVGHARGKHPLNRYIAAHKTWEGAAAGLAASVVAGIVIGVTTDPPFSVLSGVVFGAVVGVLVPLGDLGFAAIKRSAGVRHSGTYLGAAGGALDVVNGVLFAAPAFYWAFRTIAL